MTEMNQDEQPIVLGPDELRPAVSGYDTSLTTYLDSLGLPSQDLLVNVPERWTVVANTPEIIKVLGSEQLAQSHYISKFIAAVGAGLFDAALNFLWDETVKSLREKASRFDLAYFYDNAAKDPNRRGHFATDADLDKLTDWELIQGCRDTGLISDLGFKHLDYIRSMRHWASAAHPNQNTVTGFQLLAWLQTCIVEVIAKEPDEPAVEVRKLIHNIRNSSLGLEDLRPFNTSIKTLPPERSETLLRTIFGMYTDVALPADVRNNIKTLADSVWSVCDDEARSEIGIKATQLGINADKQRFNLAREFLELVEGLRYLPEGQLAAEIASALEDLRTAHMGMDNFYNEPAPALFLKALVPENGSVPNAIAREYVQILTLCSIGNGYGVSHRASITYEELLARFQDKHMTLFASMVLDEHVRARLQYQTCADRYSQFCSYFESLAVGQSAKSALAKIASYRTDRLANAYRDPAIQALFPRSRT